METPETFSQLSGMLMQILLGGLLGRLLIRYTSISTVDRFTSDVHPAAPSYSTNGKRKCIDAQKAKRHTTGGIPRWSPTLVLVARFSAYVWQSGRDAQFSLTYGRMCYAQLLCYTCHSRDHKTRSSLLLVVNDITSHSPCDQ